MSVPSHDSQIIGANTLPAHRCQSATTCAKGHPLASTRSANLNDQRIFDRLGMASPFFTSPERDMVARKTAPITESMALVLEHGLMSDDAIHPSKPIRGTATPHLTDVFSKSPLK